MPKSAKTSKLIPIYKNGDSSKFENYRPICIAGIIDKIIQQIVNQQLLDYLENNNLICSQQYGFRPNSGTINALMDITNDIQNKCDQKKKQIVAAVFLDL